MGSWTEKRIRRYMAEVLGPDWSLDGNTHHGYEVRDDYRPGMVWKAKTPAEAIRKAGAWLPLKSWDYY